SGQKLRRLLDEASSLELDKFYTLLSFKIGNTILLLQFINFDTIKKTLFIVKGILESKIRFQESLLLWSARLSLTYTINRLNLLRYY
ncbi:hypothetical protein RZN22_15365, partial [Bacillaceae bacterium S4-13-58]